MAHRIINWNDISEEFSQNVLLGNGASISIAPNLSYSSLYQEAITNSDISTELQSIFDHFHTTDFEFILKMLWHTMHINRALNIQDTVTENIYLDLRNTLINTIKNNHPEINNARQYIKPIWNFLQRFKIILSLNYDLILYWSILEGNENLGQHFKDCFVYGEFEYDWEKFKDSYGNARNASLVFYPHGNLILSSTIQGGEEKINIKSQNSLMEQIIDCWNNGNNIPLFVSEGTSEQKLQSIRRSPYLYTVYNEVLPNINDSLLIYGWSMQEVDEHIIRALLTENINKICYSVHTNNRSASDVSNEIDRITSIINSNFSKIEYYFVNSSDENLWINNTVV